MTDRNSICIAAIAKNEEPFLDEWLIYHRLIGVDHFFIYDDDPGFPLKKLLEPHAKYVTVIEWSNQHFKFEGRNRQTKAYFHAVNNFADEYQWIAFIDIDEFIVLKEQENLSEFLSLFENYSAISLNWHVFGHNGFFNDPEGLITEKLIRRKFAPNRNVKTITRSKSISKVTTAHFCRMRRGDKRADANGLPYDDEMYDGKTQRAHINHYQCRSFVRWMNRVDRGEVSIETKDDISNKNSWKVDSIKCLKQFVSTVALDKNEYIDTYMLKYSDELREVLMEIKC